MVNVEKGANNKIIVLFLALVVIALSIYIIDNPFSDNKADLKSHGTGIGDSAPDIEFISLTDQNIRLSNFSGSFLIINAWTSWCPYCLDEIPLLQNFANNNKNRVNVLFVHRTSTESIEKAKDYINKFSDKNIESSIVFDPNDKFYSTFFGFGMPVTLVLNPEGVIIDKVVGPLSEEYLSKLSSKFLEGQIDAKNIKDNKIKITSDGKKYLVDPSKIVSGGPPKDGIPSLDNPKFESIKEANKWLKEDDFGIGVYFNNIPKFYPYRIMVRHEIVNDFFKNKPVVVSYCPLCATGIVYQRNLGNAVLDFGVSGKLYNSNLLMYDRQTQSFWSQILGKALFGNLTGSNLERIDSSIVKYSEWKKLNQDTIVLSIKTGFPFSYNLDPYKDNNYDYYTNDEIWYRVDNVDNRLKPKEMVFGVDFNSVFKAYKSEDIKKNVVLNDKNIVVFYNSETNQANFYLNDGMTFKYDNGKILDNFGNKWGFEGLALDGNIKGETLKKIIPIYSFWFSWSAFHPDTELYALK